MIHPVTGVPIEAGSVSAVVLVLPEGPSFTVIFGASVNGTG